MENKRSTRGGVDGTRFKKVKERTPTEMEKQPEVADIYDLESAGSKDVE